MMAAEKTSTDTAVNAVVAEKTVIVGLGKTGLSCARFLARRGESFVVTDTRENPPALTQLRQIVPKVKGYFGGWQPQVFAQAQRVIVSPGVSVNEAALVEAKRNGAAITGDIALFAQFADAPIVAITGSNGKSTVTTLLAEMAQQAGVAVRVGGNLGTPALDLLSQHPSIEGETSANELTKPAFYIIELSSFQLETTPNLNALAAVVLNISADHMDRYANLREYQAAKQNVYHGCKTRIVNRDDPLVMQMLSLLVSDKTTNAQSGEAVISFGLNAPAEGDFGVINKGLLNKGLLSKGLLNKGSQKKDDQQCLAKGKQCLMPVTELRLPGQHNIANALAALALGDAMQLPLNAMLSALRAFTGLAHRTQWVASIKGVNWYNDSKGTNVGATVSAIAGMPGPKILIAGGDGKGADFTPLREAVRVNQVRAVVLMGKDAPAIQAVLERVVPVARADTMPAAVAEAHTLAQVGDSVILSPACASFDMFRDYQHRGEVFVQAVKDLQ